jgi:hypothetical protein
MATFGELGAETGFEGTSHGVQFMSRRVKFLGGINA